MASDFRRWIDESTKIDDGPPARYQLQLRRDNLDKESDEESKLRRFTLGESNAMHINKTILLVGETGAGKSTLINALVNFVMGVEFEDKVWFEVISDENRPQSESQTSAVSVYEIYGFEGTTVPYSLTIIDTPGYGDTEDKIIMKLLQDLFCLPDGVDTINAVGLVMKASENRLNQRLAYIFNSVTSLFGKDMEKNVVVLMTYSDSGKPKDALKALKDAKIICARDMNNETVHFLFNNRQKKTIEDENDEEEAKNAFKISNKGMKTFTKSLETTKPQSLKMTVKVMEKRMKLEDCIQKVKEHEAKREENQEAIRKNREEHLQCELETEKNKNFSKTETYKEKENLERRDDKAVTCNNCEENCHYPGCTWAWSPGWCEVMKDDKCISCSGKCSVDVHVKEKWRYVTKTRTVINQGMKDKFEENKTKSEEKTTLLKDLEKKISELQEAKDKCLNEAFDLVEQLKKIALNVDSVSTFVHLEFLIEKMKETGENEKIKTLETMRDRMSKK